MKNLWILSSLFVALICLSACPAAASVEPPRLSVLPWNGAPAAISLTFDDGDPSHLDTAIPELDSRDWKATFFLIANKVDRVGEWKMVFANGHELGNHSLDHGHATGLSSKEEKNQVVGARNRLALAFGVPVRVFAYPFVEITPGLKKRVEETHLGGRGGFGSTYYYQAGDNPDWANLTSRTTKTADTPETHRAWLKETLDAKAWTLLMIHGLEGTKWGWEPISKAAYTALLDGMAEGGFWVAPMGQVAAYWRAQKILEATPPREKDGAVLWTWKKDPKLPKRLVLKARIETPPGENRAWIVTQKNKPIQPDASGVFPIRWDDGEVTLTPE